PGDLVLLMALGRSYPVNQRDGAEERLRWYQAAVAVAPANSGAHLNLGLALRDTGNLDGAMAEFREAIRLDPKYAMPHNNLAIVLRARGTLNGAMAESREAIRLDPKYAMPHNNLRRTEPMAKLLPRLPDVLAEREKPQSPMDACDFARLCGLAFQ